MSGAIPLLLTHASMASTNANSVFLIESLTFVMTRRTTFCWDGCILCLFKIAELQIS
jgi:hypothetical protein